MHLVFISNFGRGYIEYSHNNLYLLFEIRFTLEMISHINHVITTPYGHAILIGGGGDGRATAAR